eukprot:UN05073
MASFGSLQLLQATQFPVSCVCGAEMAIKEPAKEYGSSSNDIRCDSCNSGNLCFTYHCPQKQNNRHPNGYDYCIKCAMQQFQHQSINTYIKQQEGNNDMIKKRAMFEERMKLINFITLKNRFDRTHLDLAPDS